LLSDDGYYSASADSTGVPAAVSNPELGSRPQERAVKFYDCATAPSPRRVRIFLAEKGITVPMVQVDLRRGEQFGEAFRAINPDGTVPVLVLDSGTRIADIVGICRYFEEAQPEPPLMGRDAEDKAVVESWQRWCEREGFYAVTEAFRNAAPGLKHRALPGPDDYKQIPALAERGRARLQRFFERLDARLGASEFVAGSRYTIADITALVSIDFAGWIKLGPGESQAHLKRWHAAVSARPSAKA
jgi:glutathione S-transferase